MFVMALQAHGIKYLFTLAGGHISPILVACEEIGIRVIDTRHEVSTHCVHTAVIQLFLSSTQLVHKVASMWFFLTFYTYFLLLIVI